MRLCLCTYQESGRNSSLIELRGIQDLRRDTHGDDPESVEAPSAIAVHQLGESLASIRYRHFDNTKHVD